MWKYLGESVLGTSHRERGVPCQDAHRVSVHDRSGEAVLIAVAADGAGSATRADLGANTACEAVRDAVLATLSGRIAIASLEPADIQAWFQAARRELERVAATLEIGLRDLACTILLAIVGADAAVFAQLGDGAIITGEGDHYTPVFWPPAGEYANVTDFLTDADFAERLLLALVPTRIDAVALLTDGLQRLALDYTTQQGHPRFFGPLLAPLRTSDPNALRDPLRSLLDSPRINERTDDDKTLILALREPPDGPAEPHR